MIMKRMIINTFLIGTTVVTGSALSSEMQCFVDTLAYDTFTSGGCLSAAPARVTSAVFKVSSNNSISSIIWTGDASGQCATTDMTCSIDIRQYSSKNVGATVLYSDGTWESVPQITAWYEGLD